MDQRLLAKKMQV